MFKVFVDRVSGRFLMVVMGVEGIYVIYLYFWIIVFF